MSRVTYENFVNFSKKMLSTGMKVCPCCLSHKLEFTTDDEHTYYILECKACHIGVHDHLFKRVKNTWEYRALDIPSLNAVTTDIDCSWWDDNTSSLKTITLKS